MKKNLILAAFGLILVGFLFVPSGYAAFYKYLDKNGTPCFVDDLQSVPEAYRSSAVLIQDDSEENRQQLPTTSSQKQSTVEVPAIESRPLEEAAHAHPLAIRLTITAGVVFCAALLLVLLAKQPPLKEKPSLLSTIRLSLAGLVSLYLIVAHGSDVIDGINKVSNKIDRVQEQSAQKGKKIAETMKKLNDTVDDAKKQQEEINKVMGEQQ